jgi:hypothetical protein
MGLSHKAAQRRVTNCRTIAQELLDAHGFPLTRKAFDSISTGDIVVITDCLEAAGCIKQTKRGGVTSAGFRYEQYLYEWVDTAEARELLASIAESDLRASQLLFPEPVTAREDEPEITPEPGAAVPTGPEPFEIVAQVAEVLQSFDTRLSTLDADVRMLSASISELASTVARQHKPPVRTTSDDAAELLLSAVIENTEATKAVLGKATSLAIALETFTISADSFKNKSKDLVKTVQDDHKKLLDEMATHKLREYAVILDAIIANKKRSDDLVEAYNAQARSIERFSDNTRGAFNMVLQGLDAVARGEEVSVIGPLVPVPAVPEEDTGKQKAGKKNGLPSLGDRIAKQSMAAKERLDDKKLIDSMMRKDMNIQALPPSVRAAVGKILNDTPDSSAFAPIVQPVKEDP